MTKIKLAIIGSGPAGYTAAIYGARAGFAPVVFVGPEPGGQLATTTEVGNFPGFPDDILGPELMDRMKRQAERFGATMQSATITKVDLAQRPFQLWAGEESWVAECVIIATGASAQWLGLPNEQRLRGKGVSACATCDGFFFKGKDVAVVGGGDSAMEEATYLTKFAKHVHVIVRKDNLRASTIMVKKAQSNPAITFHFGVIVDDVLGDRSVSGVRLKKLADGSSNDLNVQGLFLAIGHKPNTQLFSSFLDVDAKGYLQVTDQVKTTIDGIFVAGDVRDFRYRQAVSAAGWGCMAALEAEKYLERLHEVQHGAITP